MANSINGMTWKNDFWEKASIELDIAIDKQDEKRCGEIVECPHDTIKNILELKAEDKNRERFWDLIIDKNGDVKIGIKVCDRKPESNFWTAYFLAKRIRAELQSKNNDSQLKKLDWIVDFLIKKTAPIITEECTFQYLLLMLELAACTIGEQSLGFSEKAKEILNSTLKNNKLPEWKRPLYTALIHFNQGVAKAHMHNLHDALKEYDGALKEYEKAKIVDQDIWSQYLYYPALLQKSEALIKMQFSYNALKTLQKVSTCGDESFYLDRKSLLEATCYIELEDWHRFDEHYENKIKTIKGFDKKSLAHKGRFLAANTPQKPKKGKLPSLLASSYNALVLERAKKNLEETVDKTLNSANEGKENEDIAMGLSEMKILDFIKSNMVQCKNNRFDKLTLEETILDYLKIIVRFVKGKEMFFKTTKRPVQVILELISILKEHNFIGEISSEEKPPLQYTSIKKVRDLFEEINDEILKEWSNREDSLPNELRAFFKFEEDLLKSLLRLTEQGKRPDLVHKKYDIRSLKVRQNLISAISKELFDSGNITTLKENFVCVCDKDVNEKRKKCIGRVLEVIKTDDKLTEDGILQFADYNKIIRRESERFTKHITGRSVQPIFNNKVKDKKEINYSMNYVGLRRWNSYTPELSFSVGGGHFVFLSHNGGKHEEGKGKVDIGIAIDPGFDFIRNFFRQGFTLTDIDIVLLTHGHPDHIRDFPAVIELLNENRKRIKNPPTGQKRIYAVMSLGCYQRLDEHIARDPFKLLFYDTIIMDFEKDTGTNPLKFFYPDLGKKESIRLVTPDNSDNRRRSVINLKIEFFESLHQDHSESDSYGYLITINNTQNNGKSAAIRKLGFTGDSKWFPEYHKKFQECDIICSHIGSIIESPRRFDDYEFVGSCERQLRTQNHPYFFGEILFLQDLKLTLSKGTLLLISEFGEEMKGQIRSDLAKRLNRHRERTGCWSDLGADFSNSCKICRNFRPEIVKNECENRSDCEKGSKNIFTIPVDVGLRISIPLKNEEEKDNHSILPGKVHCIVCDEFVSPEEIDYEVFSHEEAIFYICKTCRRSKSIDVRHAIYQKYHENGREIEKYVSFKETSESQEAK